MDRQNYILVSDSSIEGKFVAFRSINDHTIVASGDDAEEVKRDAEKSGAEHPMIFYVPEKNMTCCY